ncbi:MAG: hypothetical protein ACM3XS_10030 [Bacteroidota bacterium]
MSAAKKVIQQVATGQVTGRILKKKADAVVSTATVTTAAAADCVRRPAR